MQLFLSSYLNKVDKKGRVSVPANFRAVLTPQSFAGIIAYNSFVNPCIEASGYDRLEQLSNAIDRLDPFSAEHDAFATAILGGSVQMPFDGEGRIILPEELIAYAKLSEQACFVGKGKTFEIWNPELYTTYAAKAREHAKAQRALLRSPQQGGL